MTMKLHGEQGRQESTLLHTDSRSVCEGQGSHGTEREPPSITFCALPSASRGLSLQGYGLHGRASISVHSDTLASKFPCTRERVCHFLLVGVSRKIDSLGDGIFHSPLPRRLNGQMVLRAQSRTFCKEGLNPPSLIVRQEGDATSWRHASDRCCRWELCTGRFRDTLA